MEGGRLKSSYIKGHSGLLLKVIQVNFKSGLVIWISTDLDELKKSSV